MITFNEARKLVKDTAEEQQKRRSLVDRIDKVITTRAKAQCYDAFIVVSEEELVEAINIIHGNLHNVSLRTRLTDPDTVAFELTIDWADR